MSTENEEQNDIVEVTTISSDLAFQQEAAFIDKQIATAKAFPRNIQRAKKNAIDIVTMDQGTAESCRYTVPRGNKKISGPSVHLAKILLQCWGNMRADARVTEINERQIVSEAVAFDLENNVALKISIRRSIMQHEYKWDGQKNVKTGRMVRMNDDMITIAGNAANSIALRNAILSVIPKGISESVYNEAVKTMTGDVSDATKLKAKARKVVDALMGTFNVTEQAVLRSIGKAAIEHIVVEDIATLISIGTALKDGDTTVELAFSESTQVNVNHEEIRTEEVIKQIEEQLEKCKTESDCDVILLSLDEELHTIMAERIETKKAELSKK